ncbi:MAG TPA: hypothetical protein DE015_04210 [Oceanospirillales bacterium]|nr:hypothetical protein [Oceanospirillales bacterium]
MDREIAGIMLSFALYLTYFLIPLVPSILIYKIFPSTSVVASGSFSGLKINSSGAFAAYLITLVISINALSETEARILEPRVLSSANGDIHFKIPGSPDGSPPKRMITLDVKGFGRGKINLTSEAALTGSDMVVNYQTRTIEFSEPIEITTLTQPGQRYSETSYMTPVTGAGE